MPREVATLSLWGHFVLVSRTSWGESATLASRFSGTCKAGIQVIIVLIQFLPHMHIQSRETLELAYTFYNLLKIRLKIEVYIFFNIIVCILTFHPGF